MFFTSETAGELFVLFLLVRLLVNLQHLVSCETSAETSTRPLINVQRPVPCKMYGEMNVPHRVPFETAGDSSTKLFLNLL